MHDHGAWPRSGYLMNTTYFMNKMNEDRMLMGHLGAALAGKWPLSQCVCVCVCVTVSRIIMIEENDVIP